MKACHPLGRKLTGLYQSVDPTQSPISHDRLHHPPPPTDWVEWREMMGTRPLQRLGGLWLEGPSSPCHPAEPGAEHGSNLTPESSCFVFFVCFVFCMAPFRCQNTTQLGQLQEQLEGGEPPLESYVLWVVLGPADIKQLTWLNYSWLQEASSTELRNRPPTLEQWAANTGRRQGHGLEGPTVPRSWCIENHTTLSHNGQQCT